MTIHEAYETNPHWVGSDVLAFESNRYGHSDIFISNPVGSTPTRLTFHSNGNSYPHSAKGEIYFSSNRIDNPLEWSKEIYTISQEGGTPSKSMNATGYHANPSANNRYIAYERGPCRMARVRYEGSANKDNWVYYLKLIKGV